MRSCLILPDDPRPETKAWLSLGSTALLLDLRAAPGASALAFLGEARAVSPRPRIYARLGPALDEALEALLETPPDGIFLDGTEGGADVQRLAAKLAVFEARAGLADGATTIIAGAAQTPAAIFALHGYKDCSPRLRALAWEGDALAAFLDLLSPVDPAAPALAVARGLLVLAAAAAGVPALDAPSARPRDAAAFRAECLRARRDGFKGKVATLREEVAIIEEIFGPG